MQDFRTSRIFKNDIIKYTWVLMLLVSYRRSLHGTLLLKVLIEQEEEDIRNTKKLEKWEIYSVAAE